MFDARQAEKRCMCMCVCVCCSQGACVLFPCCFLFRLDIFWTRCVLLFAINYIASKMKILSCLPDLYCTLSACCGCQMCQIAFKEIKPKQNLGYHGALVVLRILLHMNSCYSSFPDVFRKTALNSKLMCLDFWEAT